MKTFRASQVFVPGGMPQHTYVARTEGDLEGRLASARNDLFKLVTLTGATKSGKTVLANRIFPRNDPQNVWVDGGTVRDEDDFWSIIVEALDGYTHIQNQDVLESERGASGGIEGGIGVKVLASITGKASVDMRNRRASGTSRSRASSARTTATRLLRESWQPLIIDDFHYLDRELQGAIIRALKPLVFEGLPVVVIAIPHRRYDAVKVEREMTGRLENIDVPAWSIDELTEIPDVGFGLLNVGLEDEIARTLALEAYGSPHLMQDFCRGLCQQLGIEETVRGKSYHVARVDSSLFKRIAEGTGRVIFDKLAKGPRQRSDRKQRPLVTGETADIYRVVLMALAKLAPGMEKVNYESLRAKIRELLADLVPQAHEVSRVLEKMSEIAASDEASTPVIDWDKEDQELHITDPFFAFFLKWGVLAHED